MNVTEFVTLTAELNRRLQMERRPEGMTVAQLIQALQSLPPLLQEANTGATWPEVEPTYGPRQVYERPDGTKYMDYEVMDIVIHIHGA